VQSHRVARERANMATGAVVKYDGRVMSRSRASFPHRVADLLATAVPGLSERLLEVTIRREWSAVVPSALARRSEPGELVRGALEVRVDNSPWLQELSMRSPELLAALTARYGGAVRSIRIALGPRRPDAPASAGAPGRRPAPPRLDPREAREVSALAATLPDPVLARALRRLLTKDRLARRGAARPGWETRT
jgi:hypothetical protein